MNREIKFRALSIFKNKNWIYGIPSWDFTHLFTTDEDNLDGFSCFECITETISQFTGLCDINGKEIYEGDIVVRESDKKQSDKYIVDFKQGMFVMCNYDYGDTSVISLSCYIDSDINIRKYESEEDRLNCNKVLLKVIGNIYE